MLAAHEPEPVGAYSTDEQEAVRVQMERLLRSAHFRNSKRYPTLLRYLVEETLAGHSGLLKERILGMEVFGRAPDYDTSTDPIVRVTIAEIRKRIAQYYHEDAHSSELRIELTPGSYIPEFITGRHVTENTEDLHVNVAPSMREPDPAIAFEPAAAERAVVAAVKQPSSRVRRWYLPVGTMALLLAVAAGILAWRWLRPVPLEQLWAPVFATKGPVTFCLPMSVRKQGQGSAQTTDEAIAHVMDLADERLPSSGTFMDHELIGENVVYSDVLAMVKLESVVEQQHRPVRVRLNLGTNLNELREGPSIFIGGLDNQWTLRLISQLRYRFAGSDADRYYIQDIKAPDNEAWSVRLHDKYTSVMQDYAIVARIHSDEIGQPVLIAAGVGMSGTAAAGEFLSDPKRVAELSKRLGGAALRDHDFEAVLQTDVVNGVAGPAKILAVDVR